MIKRKATLVTISVVIVLIGIAGAIAWQINRNNQMQPEEGDSAEETTEVQQPTEDETATPVEEDSRYVTYSEEAFENADGRRVLFFHAPWCPQCRELEADMKSGTIPDDMTVFEVDYDTSTALKQQYDVTIQTTLVEVDDEGNEIGKVIAYDEPTMEFVLRELDE